MGQAKNRKAEIEALKANGRKSITPFIIRGSIVDGKVVYDTTGLDSEQTAFVDGCVKTINEEMIPELDEVPSQDTHLTMVSWISHKDFIGGVMGPFKDGHTPDSLYDDAEMRFKKSQSTSKYPQVGFAYRRDEIVGLGTEMAGLAMDMLNEGSVWPWPNAHAVFQKRGDLLVVIETI